MAVPDMWIKLLKVKFIFVFCPIISAHSYWTTLVCSVLDPDPAFQVNPDTDPVSDPDLRF